MKSALFSSFAAVFARSLCLGMLMLCLAPSSWAEKADRNKPMNIVADNLRYDDLKQTSHFTGHVVLTKGTLVIHADRIDVRQDPQGYQYGTATAQPGRKATFRQKRDRLDEWIEGEAESLVYNGRSDVIEFSRSAVIRRVRGTQVADESAGHFITYDNTTETFTVQGGQTAQTTGGRVRTMLSPSPNPNAAPVESPPAAPDSALRPASTLGTTKP